MNSPSDGDDVLFQIVSAVADLKGTTETALPPLMNDIDSDALRSLYSCESEGVEVRFTWAGCRIHVLSGMGVIVREA